jgi:hypothetical protein
MAMREQWLQAEPHSAEVAQRLAEMAARLCTGLILLGDMPGALANCHRAGALTTTLLEAHPADLAVRRQMAVNMIALGNAQRLSGQPKEAASTLQTAIEQFHPLMANDATNADLQRRMAIAYAYLANAKWTCTIRQRPWMITARRLRSCKASFRPIQRTFGFAPT